LIFLIVLLVACAAAWAMLIRPAVHNQVDAEVRSSLASTIRQIPQNVPPDEYAISAATVNANIQQQIPANSGVSSAQVHFQNGNVVLDYVYHGQSGAVTTQLVPVQGILVAQNTTVTGVLGWVESGDELQSALNDELPSVPSGYHVTGLRTANDTLYMKVNE
jgi:hypothetical protein